MSHYYQIIGNFPASPPQIWRFAWLMFQVWAWGTDFLHCLFVSIRGKCLLTFCVPTIWVFLAHWLASNVSYASSSRAPLLICMFLPVNVLFSHFAGSAATYADIQDSDSFCSLVSSSVWPLLDPPQNNDISADDLRLDLYYSLYSVGSVFIGCFLVCELRGLSSYCI